MNRPDVMDRDVAVLLGLDAAVFVETPRPVKRPARKKAVRQPRWITYGAPVAVALLVGAGFGLFRLSSDKGGAEQRPVTAPPLQAAAGPRVMSLQVRKVDGRRPARREAADALDFDPTAPVDGAAPSALAFAESAGPAPADHAPDPEQLNIAAFSMLSDKEIDPKTPPAPAAEPHAEPVTDADKAAPSTP